MAAILHIVANCADTKRVAVPEKLRLGSLDTESIKRRATQWYDRLAKYKGEGVPAIDLYAGDHWAVVRSLPTLAGEFGFEAKLWIISAGYGLIPAAVRVHPYSATFSSGHADSIARRFAQRKEEDLSLWWEAISKRPGPDPKQPHSLRKLISSQPNAKFMIVVSPPYLRAIEQDILSALESTVHPDRVLVITSRDGLRSKLNGNLIRSDARLQAALGGARVSLNARVASMIIMNSGSWGLNAKSLARKLESVVAKSPALPSYDRRRMNDDEVKTYVRKSLKLAPRASCSSLLRSLRDSQRACEQLRFKELYWSVKDELS